MAPMGSRSVALFINPVFSITAERAHMATCGRTPCRMQFKPGRHQVTWILPPGPMPPGTYHGTIVATERGGPLPLVCNCAHDDCICPGGWHPPPAALALSNKRKAALATIDEWDEEEEEDDEEWVELTSLSSLMNQDQGSANSYCTVARRVLGRWGQWPRHCHLRVHASTVGLIGRDTARDQPCLLVLT